MSNIDKQALREAAQEEIMLRSVSDTSDAWQDEASPEAVLALLDENIQLHREKDAGVNSQWKPDVCPVTGRRFFMWIEHETLGYVPTYGGPFDSYTIPTRDNSSGEFSCERYDHDFGGWVGGGSSLAFI